MCFCDSGGSWMRAEAAGEQVRLRMAVGLFLGDLAVVDQALHVRVVDRAADHLGGAEVVDARVAGVDEVALARRADEERGDRAVRLLLGGDRRQLDHQVRFEHELLERFGRVVAVRRIALEQLLRREDDLVGGLAAAALAAHAVGEDAHDAARHARVRKDLDLVLLIGPVTAVDAGRRATAGNPARVLMGENYNRFESSERPKTAN